MAWSPLQELVTLEQLKARLKLPAISPDPEDDDLELILEIAHENVMDYLTQRVSEGDEWEATVDAWTADTAPKRVLGAILAEAVFRYRFRGDDPQGQPGSGDDVVCEDAKRLLKRLRDPAIS